MELKLGADLNEIAEKLYWMLESYFRGITDCYKYTPASQEIFR